MFANPWSSHCTCCTLCITLECASYLYELYGEPHLMLFNMQSFGLRVKKTKKQRELFLQRSSSSLSFHISVWQQLPAVMKQKPEPKSSDAHTLAIPTEEQEKVSPVPSSISKFCFFLCFFFFLCLPLIYQYEVILYSFKSFPHTLSTFNFLEIGNYLPFLHTGYMNA